MQNIARTFLFIAAILGLALAAMKAGAAEGDFDYRAWQIKRALEPSAEALSAEQRGQIFIYDGLSTSDIDRIMDQAFDRIQNMMFVRVTAVNENGETVALDDGC